MNFARRPPIVRGTENDEALSAWPSRPNSQERSYKEEAYCLIPVELIEASLITTIYKLYVMNET